MSHAAAMSPPAPARLRPARPADLDGLAALVASGTAEGALLPRTREDLRSRLDDFRVAVCEGRIVGCGALHPYGPGLAEIRSLAVEPRRRSLGIGGRLVRLLLKEAGRRGVRRVFCLTRSTGFFGRQGFVVVPKERFPQKVWRDCRRCPRLERCDEVAMERAIPAAARRGGHASPGTRSYRDVSRVR